MDDLLARLSPDCRRCLAVAAVLGVEFALQPLARSLERRSSRARLLKLLDEAQAAGIVTAAPDSPDKFRFPDPGLRGAMYSTLTVSRRTRLHGVVAQAIEELYSHALEPHFAQLAHHFAQTGAADDAAQAMALASKARDVRPRCG